MENSHQRNYFKILKEHENCEIKFLKATEINRNVTFKQDNVSFTDFVLVEMENCGLIASVGALTQRPEFSNEIAPEIEQTSEGMKLKFNTFYEGKPVTVTIDDTLMFDENNLLVCASSLQNNDLYLASLLEKAFVKQACNNS